MGHLVRLSYPEAPSGSFALAVHGTSAPGVAFSDWECVTVKPGRTLNSSGRATFYVKGTVDVVVYNSSGVAVDTFTEGVRGELVGVNSPTLTGSLPNGTLGLGGDLSLTEFIATLRASFGANDGKVRETGQATDFLVKDALANIRSSNFPYFNVKTAPYNAVGDGVANDTAAIQAAITACAASGGGVVYVPRGTYLTTSSLAIINPSVSLSGDGFSSQIRYTGSSGTYAVSVTGTGAQAGNSISNIYINVTGTGGLISLSTNPGFRIVACTLKTAFTGAAVVNVTCSAFITSCYFDSPLSAAATRGIVEVGNGTPRVVFSGNDFSPAFSAISGDGAMIAAVSGAPVIVALGNSATNVGCAAIGCNVTNATLVSIGNTASGMLLNQTTNTGTYVEAGNTGGAGVIIPASSSISGTVYSQAGASGSLDHGTTAATFGPLGSWYDNYIDVTATPITVSAPNNNAWNGKETVYRIRNTTAGAVTLNWNAVYLGSSAMGTLAAGQTRVVRFIRRGTGAATGWRYAGHWDTT